MEEKRENKQVVWFDRAGAECVLEELSPGKLWFRSNRGGAVMGREEAVELWSRLGTWLDTGSVFAEPEDCSPATIQFASGYETMPED